MRAEHNLHNLPTFPVYAIGFVEDNKVILGGGGGAGRSGVKNKLRLYEIKSKDLALVNELELAKDEDAPMTMAVNTKTSEFVCGINSSEEKQKAGENQNCRVFSVKDDRIAAERSTQTLTPKADGDDYQKVTIFSPDSSLLAVGCTNNEVALLSYPNLVPASQPFVIPPNGGDLFDIDYLQDQMMVVGSKAIYFLSLPGGSTESGKAPSSEKKPDVSAPLKTLKTLTVPEISGVAKGSVCTFRSARLMHCPDTKVTTLWAIVNSTPPRSASKGAARKAYLCTWQATESMDWKLTKTRAISSKAITVFDVSPNGKLLAFGSSDLSIGILDSQSLAPLLTVLNAHEFPPTALRFNPSTSVLVSGSADNSVRVIHIPEPMRNGGGGSGILGVLLYIVLALLAVLIGWVVQQQRGL